MRDSSPTVEMESSIKPDTGRTSMNFKPVLLLLFLLVSPLLADQFDDWDANKDGRLSPEELPENLRPNFDKVDANHDGFITREEHLAFMNKNKPARPTVPDSVKLTADIPYADTARKSQRLDLLLPAKRSTEKPLPVIVYIHGGAWKGGTKEQGRGSVIPYVASGDYAGVSVEYRLSGEAIWPAQIEDCKAAIRWVKANAKEQGLDPDKIGVWGGSAGGHLVAMLGVAGDVKALEGTVGKHLDQTSRITCVADYFGPTNLLTMGDFPSSMQHNAPNSPESELIGGAILENKEKAQAASPVTYITSDDAPTFIAHGTTDPIVPYNQSETFATALKNANIPIYLETIENGNHGGFEGPKLNARLKAFYDKYLRGQDTIIETGTLKVRE